MNNCACEVVDSCDLGLHRLVLVVVVVSAAAQVELCAVDDLVSGQHTDRLDGPELVVAAPTRLHHFSVEMHVRSNVY